jgi:hypothetical protein
MKMASNTINPAQAPEGGVTHEFANPNYIHQGALGEYEFKGEDILLRLRRERATWDALRDLSKWARGVLV